MPDENDPVKFGYQKAICDYCERTIVSLFGTTDWHHSHKAIPVEGTVMDDSIVRPRPSPSRPVLTGAAGLQEGQGTVPLRVPVPNSQRGGRNPLRAIWRFLNKKG